MMWDEKKILDYITNQVEESLNLDYKAADALAKADGKKREISKDVSAMANSSGGVIIYGIAEDPSNKHLPGRIDPIDRTDFSKEWLEQVINSNIFPRINGIIIHPITLSSSPNDVVYVVEIQPSSTAHQANDLKYYKRYNFESVPMYDYEIRDIMNRRKEPIIDLELIHKIMMEKTEGTLAVPGRTNNPVNNVFRELTVTLYNNGVVVSNYIVAEVKIPKKILDTNNHQVSKVEMIDGAVYSVVRIDNTVRDVLDVEVNQITKPSFRYGPKRYEPILPRLSFKKSISLDEHTSLSTGIIYWTIYADNAEPRSGSIQVQDIKVEQQGI